MKYQTTAKFDKAFAALTNEVQRKVERALVKFQGDPKPRSLEIEKMRGYKGIWEARIDDFYRFTFEYDKDEATGEVICRYRSVGRHDILDHDP